MSARIATLHKVKYLLLALENPMYPERLWCKVAFQTLYFLSTGDSMHSSNISPDLQICGMMVVLAWRVTRKVLIRA
jgi:hypothetical protein